MPAHYLQSFTDSWTGQKWRQSLPDLPVETLAFLFTDMEGSAKLWEQQPKAMPAVLTLHEAILRRAIETNAGRIFKTVGDACYAVFRSASEAFAAGLAIQRALYVQDWGQVEPVRVRMALHIGPAEKRNDDYFGLTLNRVDRLVQIGHGGQTLLSEVMAEQMRNVLPGDVELRDLGKHQLRDMAIPERIFQVVTPDLPSDFPPLRAMGMCPTNLPAQLTSFIGREEEIASVCSLLRRADVRQVTLSGAGGTGKTRLGLQVAAQLLNEFQDGVFFISLAAISTVGLVAFTIAEALGVKEIAGQPILETLEDYLRSKHILLVLDNFEQVITAAPVVTRLLAVAPQLKVLVTSREVLLIYGEHDFPVLPLALPDLDRLPPQSDAFVSALSEYAAVKLFVERAQAAQAGFRLVDENARMVAEICARLDGLPLAIELAAAYCRTLSPQAILARLTGAVGPSSLRMLTGSLRDLPARQRTLRGAIDWSYNLLDVGEKKLFTRLAVFTGGCTPEAVEVVCNIGGDLSMDVLDGLTSLVNKSMLQPATGIKGEPRFTLLETIREYALERLEASGEARLLRQYHAGYYLNLAGRAEPELRAGPQQVAWLDRLEQEHGNLRAALTWSLERGEGEIALLLSSALWRFWYWHSHLSEGSHWLDLALDATRNDKQMATIRVRVLNGAGNLASARGDYERARALLEEGLALGREPGTASKVDLAPLLNTLGTVTVNQGDYQQAKIFYEECLALQREQDDRVGIAHVLNNLGVVVSNQGNYQQAQTFLEESLARFQELEIKWGIAYALGNLGRAALCLGDYARATTQIEESLALCQELGDRDGVAECFARLGGVAAAQGDAERAASLYRKGLSLYQQVGDKPGVAECLKELAKVMRMLGQPGRAARLFGAAEALREAIKGFLLPDERASYGRSIAEVCAQLGEVAFATAWAEGRAMTLEQAVLFALDRPTPAKVE
jgi:predicted ATPase/class 3 adenylate cyclase/Tfp pilus assembly protein PilF